MSLLTVCRTCLATNIRMHDLRNTQLREIFEKLTSTKLSSEEGRSNVCYICYSQLQRCDRFYNMSRRADNMFRRILSQESELTPEITALRPTNSFIYTPVVSMSFPDHVIETLVTVKIEPADIKEELDVDTQIKAVEIEGSPSATFNNIQMTEEDSYTCLLCNKMFENQITWNNHLSLHNTSSTMPAHVCECGKQFSTYYTFKRHQINHTKKNYSCHFCDKTFKTRTVFQNHLKTHTQTNAEHKSFICGVCNKGFRLKKYLDVHIRTHTGERPYTCDICDKSFAQLSHALSHKRTHTKMKPFSCTLCQKSFSERTTLNKHMRTHTGVKPFACDVCNKMFSARDTLKSHKRTHTGEKPYICNVCGKPFSARGNMRRHVKSHNEWTAS